MGPCCCLCNTPSADAASVWSCHAMRLNCQLRRAETDRTDPLLRWSKNKVRLANAMTKPSVDMVAVVFLAREAAMNRRIDLIAVPGALGGPDTGSADAPEQLRRAGLLTNLNRCGRPTEWLDCPSPSFAADRWDGLARWCARLADTVVASLGAGHQPFVVGGDHSIAAGTWRGVARAAAGPIGLLWIDAHLDAHVPDDSPSGNPHGMPLALLLGEGDPRLAMSCLLPWNVCVVGARDWEDSEWQRLRRLGVTIFTDADIARRGLPETLRDALRVVRGGEAGFGVTIDLDVLDPKEAPGVNTPAAGGQPATSWFDALRGLATEPDCLAVELVEYDGERDRDGMTADRVAELTASLFAARSADLIALEDRFGAHNYAPLPVVLTRAEGCHAWDTEGRQYLDMMSAYSAASFGHGHPRLLAALERQARRLAVTSRAFHNDVLPAFLRRLTELIGYDRALPVNTGLEAVETALKAARKWGYRVKGIAPDHAEIIACDGNFHGRSIAIVGLSAEPQYRDGFGPFPPGLVRVPYGDAGALEAAITPRTAAFLVEPIQGEGGVIVPPAGYLADCAALCRQHNVLLICDEIQTGLGRTGRLLASQHDGIRPDGVILGKALGGGLYPVSAFLADEDVMRVFQPGDHGSTFGGNALAAAVGLAALDLLVEEGLAERAADLGAWFAKRLQGIRSPLIREVRGRGLMLGLELDTHWCDGRQVAEALLIAGVLTKETHSNVIRLAPPLTVTRAELKWAAERIEETLTRLSPPISLAA
jgi:ornithine--oxo-acid transaminase